MDFFIDNILYFAFLVTIFSLWILFIKKKKHHNLDDLKSINLTDAELKLRAYERLAIFLERIEPVGMINRLGLHALDQDLLKSTLIKNIVIEYEYNVSQQIYVSDKLWEIIESLKNKIINNISSLSIDNEENSSDNFVKKILLDKNHLNMQIKKVQKVLKQEARDLL